MSQPRRTEWPPDALALFAEYAGHREPHRPIECDHGEPCWVRDGPPSITRGNKSGATRCSGCGGPPRSLLRTGRPRR